MILPTVGVLGPALHSRQHRRLGSYGERGRPATSAQIDEILQEEAEVPDNKQIRILGRLSIEIVISSRSSNNTCCAFIETTPAGDGPPIHKHVREEEIFTVLDGSYEFYRDGGWRPMMVGAPVLSLRNTFHAFRNVGPAPARMILVTNGGGIDEYFEAISTLRLPEDAEELTKISAHHGIVFSHRS